MKKFLALVLAMLMLLGSCGAPADTTAGNETTDIPQTNIPETEPPETEPPTPREDFTVTVKEDSYVFNKDGTVDKKNINFGSEAEFYTKTYPGSTATRYGYLKFDISEIVADVGITAIELELKMISKQNSNIAGLEIYGADSEGWGESTVTFATQPVTYELVASRYDLDKNGEVYSFPITSYVKKAIENGQTEIAFYLKEASTAEPLLLKFASKEAGEGSPTLSVYHGTKTDATVYEGSTGLVKPKPSEHGLDALLGIHKVNLAKAEVIEDAYVEAGTSSNKNFGSSKGIDFKAVVGKKANEFYRVPLLKFDISSFADIDFTNAYLQIYCTFKESTELPTQINVYGCDPYAWDEMTVTYNTIPEREDLVSTAIVTALGVVRIDVSDYIKECIRFGDKYISFYLEGDQNSIHRLKFSSKENTRDHPVIVISDDSAPFQTELKYTANNPWELAMENVSEWLDRWEIIKQGGDTDVEVISKIDSEYALSVDAASMNETNGANTKYTARPTRILSTLKDFTPSIDKSAMLDAYGGFMDESMKQEATGFFYTKKIGDRWWTIDPLGYPYFRVACVQITMGTTAQRAPLLAKYGSAESWAQETTNWLKDLGFNSAGGWSSTDQLAKTSEPLSQTGVLYILKNYCNLRGLDISDSGGTKLLYDVMPVFDPDFVDGARKLAKEGVKGHENANYIFGWMSDNELPDSLLMLDNTLKVDASDARFSYSYATAWTFMYLKTGKIDLSLDDITDELRLEYRAMIYDRYFKVIRDAFDRCVPNHQYMGCRLLTNCAKDEYVLRVAGYWCDVITYNYYHAWEADAQLIANQQKWAGKPFVITEWYAKGMDVWEKDNRMTNASGAGWTVRTQNDRGLFYQNFALQLLECKGCVGFDWFKYRDNDPDDLNADKSNRDSNKGILDNNANEYTDLTKHMDELNNQKYTLIKFFDKR